MKNPLFIILFFSFHSFAQQPQLVLPIGHTETIISTQFTPDGKYLLTCSGDKTAKLWEVASGRLVNTFDNLHHEPGALMITVHSGQVKQMTSSGISTRFSPDGKYIYALALDGSLGKWETATGVLVYRIIEKDRAIKNVNYSKDGNYLVTRSGKITGTNSPVSDREDIMVWNAKTAKRLYIAGENNPMGTGINVELSPDSKWILLNYDDQLVLKNITNGSIIPGPGRHADFGTTHFSPGGKYITVSSLDSSMIYLWDIKKRILSRIKVSELVEFSSDDHYILTTGKTSTSLYELPGGRLVREIQTRQGINIPAHFSPGNKYIFLSALGGVWHEAAPYYSNTSIWETVNPDHKLEIGNDTDHIHSVIFSPDNKYFVTLSDRGILLYDSSGNLRNTISPRYTVSGYDLRFSPNGRNFAITEDRKVRIFNISFNDFLVTLEGRSNKPEQAEFSPDGSHIISCSNEKNIKLWEAATGRILKVFTDNKIIESAHYSPDGKYIGAIYDQDTTAWIWDALTGEKLFPVHHNDRFIESLQFSPDGKYVLTTAKADHAARIWELPKRKLSFELKDTWMLLSARFSPDGIHVVTHPLSGKTTIWDLSQLKTFNKLEDDKSGIWDCIFSPDSTYLLTLSDNMSGGSDQPDVLWETVSGNRIKQFTKTNDIYEELMPNYVVNEMNYWYNNFRHFSDDGKYLLLRNSNHHNVIVWDMEKGVVKDTLNENNDFITSAGFINPTDYIVTSSYDDSIKIWKAGDPGNSKGRSIKTIPGEGFVISPDGKRLLVVNSVQLFVYDLPDLHLLYQSLAVNESDYFIQVPGKTIYAATKNAARALSFKVNNKIFSIDQFDLQLNRPHEILRSIGYSDTTLIRGYEEAWRRRVKRAGFREQDLNGELHLPEIVLQHKETFPVDTTGGILNISFLATDNKFNLDRYYVYINDVPVTGVKGASIRNKKQQSFQSTIPVNLSRGFNKVQLSCMNEKAIESLKETFYINYQPSPQLWQASNIYFIGIGVNDYKDTSMNLRYAAKDIRDLATVFRNNGVLVDTFINEAATRQNILGIKKELMKTGIEDKVIISVSGHGILDDSLDFYYATWDMNFKRPSEFGLRYEELEGLLDDIPARKKLLFIDACQSGEVDKEYILDSANYKEIEITGKVRGYWPRGGKVEVRAGSAGLQNSFELMKELFTDFSKGNGAVVISAAGGLEYAYEDEKYQNGVFTYCLLKALSEEDAEKQGKAAISINELKEYITRKVEELTKGRQRPTARKENLAVDWKIW